MCKLLETVFEKRGYTDEFLYSIEEYHHRDLLSVQDMIHELKVIHDNQDLMVILSDFDMDGVMCGTSGFAGFAELGFNVALFIPDTREGYGFDELTIKRLLAQYPDAKAIITADVGITCYAGIDYAKQCGIKVLVTDHHIEKPYPMGKLRADVTVDPMRMDETYEHPAICGAYVLYQVMMNYAKYYGTVIDQEQIRRLVVFAGIGTISDSMPLLYENRKIVRDSISLLRVLYSSNDMFVVQAIRGCDIYRRAFLGLFETIHLLSDMGKLPKGDASIDEDFYGYYLAPMFNSLKRMEGDVTHGFAVFFGPNPYEEASYLFQLNEERKKMVVKYLAEIPNRPQPYEDVNIFFTDAPGGICGLLAQRLIERTGLPTFVLRTVGHTYKGSGRAPLWYPALNRCIPAGFYLAGHNPAFGCGFTDSRELKVFVAFLKKDVTDRIAELGPSYFENLKPVYDIVIDTSGHGDTTIDILAFVEYVHDLHRYLPFGKGFEKPRILLKFYANEGTFSVMGSLKQHMKVVLHYGFTVLLFNQAALLDKLKNSTGEICVEGSLDISMWNDSHTVNFIGTVIESEDA